MRCSGRMLVRFTADTSLTRAGFAASFIAAPAAALTRAPAAVGCARVSNLTAPSGEVVDGSGAEPYLPNANCTWNIVAPRRLIALSFVAFDLELPYDRVSRTLPHCTPQYRPVPHSTAQCRCAQYRPVPHSGSQCRSVQPSTTACCIAQVRVYDGAESGGIVLFEPTQTPPLNTSLIARYSFLATATMCARCVCVCARALACVCVRVRACVCCVCVRVRASAPVSHSGTFEAL